MVGPVENVMEIFLLVEHLSHKGEEVGYLGQTEEEIDHPDQKVENVRMYHVKVIVEWDPQTHLEGCQCLVDLRM